MQMNASESMTPTASFEKASSKNQIRSTLKKTLSTHSVENNCNPTLFFKSSSSSESAQSSEELDESKDVFMVGENEYQASNGILLFQTITVF